MLLHRLFVIALGLGEVCLIAGIYLAWGVPYALIALGLCIITNCIWLGRDQAYRQANARYAAMRQRNQADIDEIRQAFK
jgi:tetrahydromethanopterin S-methyltransferase subunit C